MDQQLPEVLDLLNDLTGGQPSCSRRSPISVARVEPKLLNLSAERPGHFYDYIEKQSELTLDRGPIYNWSLAHAPHQPVSPLYNQVISFFFQRTANGRQCWFGWTRG
jgi:hypothetical protein